MPPEAPRRTDSAAFGEVPAPAPARTILRRRNPWLALLLSILAIGVGQIYNGQWKKGLLFFAADLGLGVGLGLAMGSFAGLLVAGAALAALNLAAAADACLCARRLGAVVPGPWNRGWVYGLAVAAALASGAAIQSGIEAVLYESYKAPSGSMLPTIQVGDRFMAEVLSPADSIGRGDVVIFLEPESGARFVKRVVGLPGETVSIAARRVFIDGRPLDDPRAFHTRPEQDLPVRDNLRPVILGPDEYFCMGDNRESSYDSRWIGPIRRAAMLGRALYVFWPGPSDGRWSRLGASLR